MYTSGIPDLARAYQEERQREAELRRLSKPANTTEPRPEPRLRARFLARLGRLLISIGSRLVARYTPAPACSPCLCHDVAGQALG